MPEMTIDQLEQEVMGKAQQLEGIEQEAMDAVAPIVELSKAQVAKLIATVNRLIEVFGGEPIQIEATDISGPMPNEIFNALNMVKAAITDSGLVDYDFMFADFEDPRFVDVLVGKLDNLANDKAFITFLKGKPEQMEPAMEVAEAPMDEMEAEEVTDEPSDEDLDKLIMERM